MTAKYGPNRISSLLSHAPSQVRPARAGGLRVRGPSATGATGHLSPRKAGRQCKNGEPRPEVQLGRGPRTEREGLALPGPSVRDERQHAQKPWVCNPGHIGSIRRLISSAWRAAIFAHATTATGKMVFEKSILVREAWEPLYHKNAGRGEGTNEVDRFICRCLQRNCDLVIGSGEATLTSK